VTVQPIRLFGDPVLRTQADPVRDFDKELRNLVRDLTATLLDQGGAGLAAPQIGVGLRVFAFDVDDIVGHLINPELHFPDEQEQDGPEGCLSIPGIYMDTKRRQNVVANGFNEHGDPIRVVGTDLMARCIQHETDHLDGVLFLDRLGAKRRCGRSGRRRGTTPARRRPSRPARTPPGACGRSSSCGCSSPVRPRWRCPAWTRCSRPATNWSRY
jgi:peptide deformylase